MKYLVGLIVFSAIGYFLIVDTTNFYRRLKISNKRNQLIVDFGRLLILVAMAGIGYKVASETFQQPNDWIVFLVKGIIGAFLIRLVRAIV
ncbi:hypothetical protein H6F74_08775 [Trichocoleus sp. FACHB-90]|uniref:hypothetical protein n=1 Tax=Cyanophyceae TaxID=3028117 RepID=UPI0016880587|nr:hypothetical protein [Trichocoleus sp. FACHB-90]MBD1926340.1 hypothetical protein [Trichocoleus sp. FACHB-90]